MIVNLRGTHGSGKSSVVTGIMRKYPTEVVEEETLKSGKVKALIYRAKIKPVTSEQLIIIGNYENACGGCDGIQPYDRIWPLVDKYGSLGYNVLFEGALVSSSYGNIGRSSEAYGGNFVFAFLDTPIDVCLARIAQRRAAKGNFKPVEPKNTVTKWEHVMSSIPKIRDEFGRRCATIRHTHPVIDTMKLYGVNLRKEP